MSERNTERPGFFARLGQAQTPPPWSWGDVGLAILVLALGSLMIASAVALAFFPNAETPEPLGLLLGWIIGLGLVTAFVLIRWRSSQEKFAALQLGSSAIPLYIAFLLGVGGALTADLVAAGGSGNFSLLAPVLNVNLNEAAGIILAALFLLLVQPIAEGLVFSGVLLPKLRAALGAWPGYLTAVIAYAGFYALVYGAWLPQEWLIWHGFAYPLVVGLFVLAVRVGADSTRAAILAQIGAGLTALIVLLAVG